MRATLYRITGRTYENRNEIKRIAGATWDPADRAWFVRLSGNGSTATIWRLRSAGCRVEAVTE